MPKVYTKKLWTVRTISQLDVKQSTPREQLVTEETEVQDEALSSRENFFKSERGIAHSRKGKRAEHQSAYELHSGRKKDLD